MPIVHGVHVPYALPKMACGGVPVFDSDSEFSYRCDQCGAVVGSMGQPKRCVEINEADALRGKDGPI